MSTNIFRKYIDLIKESEQLDEGMFGFGQQPSGKIKLTPTGIELLKTGDANLDQKNLDAFNKAVEAATKKLNVYLFGIGGVDAKEYETGKSFGIQFRRPMGPIGSNGNIKSVFKELIHGKYPGIELDNTATQQTSEMAEGFTDTLKSVWRGLKAQVVDFAANAVGLPDDQRREVFVQAGNEFSNEVIKLLADHPARDKLIPMVREIGGYMTKARTVEELKSLMDKAGLFLADVESGKFNPSSGVAKPLSSYRDKQGVAEEELDEAGTPDAVRRIEQLVQYK
jgi:hypothetical protein